MKAPPPPPPKPHRHRRAIVITTLSVLVVAGASIGGLQLFNKPSNSYAPETFVAVSADGKFFASARSGSDNVYLWNTATRRVAATFTVPDTRPGSILGIAISPDSRMLAAYDDGTITVFDVGTKRIITTITQVSSFYLTGFCLSFSPNSKLLTVCGDNNKLYLWDLAQRQAARTLIPTTSSDYELIDAAFSPDGKTLAVPLLGSPLAASTELWNTTTGRIFARISTGSTAVHIVYSHDGRTLVAANYYGVFTLWDTADSLTAKETITDPATNDGSSDYVSAAFSPDDKTLATADSLPDNSAFLWNVASGHLVARLTDPNSRGVTALAYAPDGGTLLTADANGEIYVWNLGTRSVVATLTTPSP